MKFFFADSQDFIDPGFDFEREQSSPNRRVQRDDLYPHEFFDSPPYDGLMVSRAIVGDVGLHGKYTTAQSMRFRREGVRSFLRYYPSHDAGEIIGDCGAFSYVRLKVPPYTVAEIVEYYQECEFDYGVSIDHVILGYTEQAHLEGFIPEHWQERYDLTLRLAEDFLTYCHNHRVTFKPIGVAQGWSPTSYSEAARRLVSMGYDYIGIGGLVPLKANQIHRILEAVREVAPPPVHLHLFGFTKAGKIGEFMKYSIESFDSTSPLLRAFKDSRHNYLSGDKWYTAIRVPSADENLHLKRQILAGIKQQSQLRELEKASLDSLRLYAVGAIDVETVLESVERYGLHFASKVPIDNYRRTLLDRPWEHCPCRACRESGIEVIIFRGSNRNRRRGFHNLWEFYRQLCDKRK